MLSASRLESAVDYITAVTTHPKTTNLMLNRAVLMCRREAKQGGIAVPWSMSGFDGLKVNQLQFGSRGHEGIVRLSGNTAALDWFEFYQDCDRVTRIDVQETYRLAQPVTPFILTNYKQIKRWSKDHHKNLTVSIWTNNQDGCTLYIGARQSEVMVRIYNKAAESQMDHYQDCVRYEVEFKGTKARNVSLCLASGNMVQDTIHRLISPLVLNRAGSFPTIAEEGPPIGISGSQKASDASKRCRWLEKAVRPSVRLVLDHLGPCATREALGLSDEDLRSMLACSEPD